LAALQRHVGVIGKNDEKRNQKEGVREHLCSGVVGGGGGGNGSSSVDDLDGGNLEMEGIESDGARCLDHFQLNALFTYQNERDYEFMILNQ